MTLVLRRALKAAHLVNCEKKNVLEEDDEEIVDEEDKIQTFSEDLFSMTELEKFSAQENCSDLSLALINDEDLRQNKIIQT